MRLLFNVDVKKALDDFASAMKERNWSVELRPGHHLHSCTNGNKEPGIHAVEFLPLNSGARTSVASWL